MHVRRSIKRGIGVVVLLIVSWASSSQAVLVRDNGLILDDETGLRWAPVGLGVLAPEDLLPGFRYATTPEVADLLRYIPNDPCINVAPAGSCDTQTIQAALDFIDIFATGFPNQLRAIYDPDLFPDGTGTAMALSLFVNSQEQQISLDTQSVNFPRPLLEEGMFLIFTAIPEPSTLLLVSGGLLFSLSRIWKRAKR